MALDKNMLKNNIARTSPTTQSTENPLASKYGAVAQPIAPNPPISSLSASEDVKEIEIALLDENPLNSQYPIDENELNWLADSIAKDGVLQPILISPQENGRFEIIAGHRRARASSLAGRQSIPAIIKQVDAETALIMFHATNLGSRENLLLSSKAFAYRDMEQAEKTRNAENKKTTATLAELTGENVRKIQRYLRLTYLCPKLLKMADANQIAFVSAVDLSYLSEEAQENVVDVLEEAGLNAITPKQANALKLTFQESQALTREQVKEKLVPVKEEKIPTAIKISYQSISSFFAENIPAKEIEKVIVEALTAYQKKASDTDAL